MKAAHVKAGEATAEKAPAERPAARAASPASKSRMWADVRQSVGNLAVQRMMRSGSTRAGAPSGMADAAAAVCSEGNLSARARYSSAPAGVVQKKCAACSTGATCTTCEQEERPIQTKDGAGPGAGFGPGAAPKIPSLRGGGRPLPDAERDFFEPRLGADLSGVRVHADAGAALSAERLGARAFTAGSDIAFAHGEYRPESAEGRRLLAHELTHVVQQSSGGVGVQGAGAGEDAYEREADEAARVMTEGGAAAGPAAEEGRPAPAGSGAAPAVQREGKDHSDESYLDFVGRVYSAAISRLSHNISALTEWSAYVSAMEDFQLGAQLMAGNVDEYAAHAIHLNEGSELFETFSGTHEPGERAYTESQLAPDASYREKANSVMSLLAGRSQGYMTDPSVAERMQVLTGERSKDDLPKSTFVSADYRYHHYEAPIRNFLSGESGGCQTCHDINFAWQKTIEEFGDPLPKGPAFHSAFRDPTLFQSLTGQSAEQPGPLKFDAALAEKVANWIQGVEPTAAAPTAAKPSASHPMPEGPPPPSPFQPLTQPATQTDANVFAPEMALPKGVEAPVRHSDLCGDPPPAEASDYRNIAASWGPNSAVVMGAVQKIGAVLAPLGPRGYQVLPRETFDELWKADPKELERIRERIQTNIGARQAKYRELIADIATGGVPYVELCPIVDELLPTTGQTVQSLVKFEVEANRLAEKVVNAILAVVGAAMLLFAFIFPPAIMLSAPMLAAGAGLAVAGLAIGARDYRRGTQYGRGARSGVYTASQEASAESLRFWGMVNMVLSAFALYGSVRALNAAPGLRGAGALAESTPVGAIPGTRISEIPGGGKMVWHPDFPNEVAFLDSEGLTMYSTAGGKMEELAHWPSSTVVGAEGGAAPAGAGVLSLENALPGPRRPLGLLVEGETLPNPNQCFAVQPSPFQTGGASRSVGPMKPTPTNPSGLETNCGFCSISRALVRQSPEGTALVNADELYNRTLKNLRLPTDTLDDPLSRMLVFPDRQGFERVAERAGYEALFTGEGNRLSEYTITSVAESHGLRVRPANNTLNEWSRSFGGSVDDIATKRWEAMEEAGTQSRLTFDEVKASITRQRANLQGDYIIGSTGRKHFMNMTIQQDGRIVAEDVQVAGELADMTVYEGLPAIKGRMGTIDFILRVEGLK